MIFFLFQTKLAQVPSRLEKEAQISSAKTERGKEPSVPPAAEISPVSSQPAQSIEGKLLYSSSSIVVIIYFQILFALNIELTQCLILSFCLIFLLILDTIEE